MRFLSFARFAAAPASFGAALTLIGLVALALPATPAWAEEHHPISGTHSVTDVAGACADAGGDFGFSSDGGTYGCTKHDCDGKGGDCTVTCDSKSMQCGGSTPAIIVRASLLTLLQNGDRVNHHYAVMEGPATTGGGRDSASTADDDTAPQSPPDIIK